MEHLGFALRMVLPSVLLLLLGAWLRKKNILSGNFSTEGDRLCFKVLFPALVFKSITNSSSDPSRYLKSITFSYVLIAVSIIIGLIVVPRIISNRKQIAVIVQGAYRGNYTMYGIAFSQLLGNDETVAIASMIAAATLPVLNSTSVAMYAHYTGDQQHSVFHTLAIVLKNPIIWAIILALTVNATGVTPPVIIETFIKNLASIATPLAFILLGTRLTKEYIKADTKIMATVLFVKLIVMPAIFIPTAVMLFNIKGPELVPVFLFAAAPCAITTYQLAVQYEADERLAGNLVSVSTLVSTVSICLIISMLKTMALI